MLAPEALVFGVLPNELGIRDRETAKRLWDRAEKQTGYLGPFPWFPPNYTIGVLMIPRRTMLRNQGLVRVPRPQSRAPLSPSVAHGKEVTEEERIKRMLEAKGRGMWSPSDEVLERLQELYDEAEDEVEGVTTSR